MSENNKKIQSKKLVALILMLIPVISIVGFIIYLIEGLKGKMSMLEIIVAILTIPFGFFAAIFLWLNALGVIKL